MSLARALTISDVDFFCLGKKFLVFNLVNRNLKIKYKRSVFGFLWTILHPLALAAVFYFVFKIILKVSIPHYLGFILSGILPWSFFALTLGENVETLVANSGLLSKVPVPIQIFPLVGTLTNLFTLIMALPIMLGAAILSDVQLGTSLLGLPILLLELFLIAYSLSLVLSIFFVYFRDLRHLISIILQIWFYGTPVLYSEKMIPENLRFVLHLNPVGDLFVAIKTIVISGEWPSMELWLIPAGWSLTLAAIAIFIRKYFCREIIEQL